MFPRLSFSVVVGRSCMASVDMNQMPCKCFHLQPELRIWPHNERHTSSWATSPAWWIPFLQQLIMQLHKKSKSKSFAIFYVTPHSIVIISVCVLCAVITVFWCMGSACRNHLHANFLHFLLRQTLNMIHIVPSTQQTRWEWISQDGSTCFFMTICAQACVWWAVRECGGTEEAAKETTSVYASMLIYLLSCCCVQSCVCSFRSSRKFLHLWVPAPLFRALGFVR